ncbi:MAG TPA: hypothetical protein VEY49_05475 [Solirubrobacteraceae bacterium]|jgi:hypothetical protein|nr:hypothetical protein [Solirubrobacteraceae bacterium]
MRIPAFARRALPSLAVAVALGVSACGEDDVERNVNQGAEQAEDAGSELEKAGEDAAREAEKAAEDAQDELEK